MESIGKRPRGAPPLADSRAAIMIGPMEDRATQEMLALARRLTAEGGDIARSYLGQARSRLKADTSLVTDADHAIQAHILEAVAARFPHHAVCAEETVSDPAAHAEPTAARYCWVIDPLDGTRNFVSGFPFFATSIAVLDRGRPVVGVVGEHNLGLVYAAAKGSGATLNDRPIRVNEPPPGSDVLLGIPSSKDRLTIDTVCAWIATKGFVLRNVGSTAVHLAMVAADTLAGAFGKQCKIWDLAAGLLLVTEAGGHITDPVGGDLLPLSLDADPNRDIPFLAAAPKLHGRLLKTLEHDKR